MFRGSRPSLNADIECTSRAGDAVIDASELTFARPLDLVVLTMLAAYRGARGRVAIRLPEDDGVASYLQRMDVVRQVRPHAAIHGTLPPDERMERDDVLSEVSHVDDVADVEALAANYFHLAEANVPRRLAKLLFKAVGELLDNACTHAESEAGAFVAAQVYSGASSGTPGLELAVADAGIGVPAHLRRNARFADLRDPVTELATALTRGASGTGDRRGNGIPDVIDGARDGWGEFAIRSSNVMARLAVSRTRTAMRLTRFQHRVPGTWIWLRLRRVERATPTSHL